MDEERSRTPEQEFSILDVESRAGLGFWAWDEVEDQLVYCSESYARMVGRSREEIMAAMTSSEMDRLSLHPEDRQRYIDADELAYETGVGIDIKFRIITADGQVRHLHEISEMVKNDAGEVIRSAGTTQDITNSVLVQDALLKALADVKRAERLANTGTYVWNWAEEKYDTCSEGYARILKMTVEEVLQHLDSLESNHDRVHPDDREAFAALENSAQTREHGFQTEYRMLQPDGGILHVREINEVELDSEGEPVRTLGSLQDITEEVLIREELRLSLADSRRAGRVMKLGTYTWNWVKDGLESCSEEFARLHAMTVEQMLESTSDSGGGYGTIYPDDRKGYIKIETEAVARGEGYTAEYRILVPSGGIRHLREICEVQLDTQGKVLRTMGVVQDVTEQVHLQDQLQQALKIKAIGQLTGGVAHDFNNLLMVIVGNLELAIHRQGDDSPHTKLLDTALRAALRGADLTEYLLAFARKQSLRMETVELRALLLRMKEILRLTMGGTIQVDIRVSRGLWLCETDTAQLENAILNLAINARDAMPKGGTLRFSLANVLLDEHYVSAHDELTAGTYIRLSVCDTGVGMPPEVQQHVFEPFYTTKDIGEGTGMGLSIVYGFLKQCRGHVSIDSEPGTGTTISLYLPANPEGTIQLEVEDRPIEHKGEGEQILVVEDDTEVRKLVVQLLRELKYRTLEAADGKDALHLLRIEPAIALLFSDLVLPGGMGGVELIEEARCKYPGLHALATTGYAEDAASSAAMAGIELLEKPYVKAQLAHSVSQALASARSNSPIK